MSVLNKKYYETYKIFEKYAGIKEINKINFDCAQIFEVRKATVDEKGFW